MIFRYDKISEKYKMTDNRYIKTEKSKEEKDTLFFLSFQSGKEEDKSENPSKSEGESEKKDAIKQDVMTRIERSIIIYIFSKCFGSITHCIVVSPHAIISLPSNQYTRFFQEGFSYLLHDNPTSFQWEKFFIGHYRIGILESRENHSKKNKTSTEEYPLFPKKFYEKIKNSNPYPDKTSRYENSQDNNDSRENVFFLILSMKEKGECHYEVSCEIVWISECCKDSITSPAISGVVGCKWVETHILTNSYKSKEPSHRSDNSWNISEWVVFFDWKEENTPTNTGKEKEESMIFFIAPNPVSVYRDIIACYPKC